MKLNTQSIVNESQLWQEKGFVLPGYDTDKIKQKTSDSPVWVHFGAGNIFRGYIACLADELIKSGDMESGIVAVDSFDNETIEKIYDPFDDLVLLVGLPAKGEMYLRVIGSIGGAECAKGEGFARLKKYAESDSLQMISFTITEKGYAVEDMNGQLFPFVEEDIKAGPGGELNSAMSIIAALLYARFKAGEKPLALVSMDNCSRNGDKLKQGVMTVVKAWQQKGHVGADFVAYTESGRVTFPWSMIDKITPRPDAGVCAELTAMGIEGMEPVKTTRGTFIAPFVNAEMPQYLVIEDSFPNGRPPLEKAGVYMTDRETVDRAEKMKVMTCLNPLHTALAVFGCLLGHTKIADEMNDPDLKKLVYDLGYKEGLPVVIDPGMIRPEDFLKEVLEQRLPNSYLPDTPQRIATDTSQKLAIRFGETIKAYAAKGSTESLVLIPMVIAAWLRYLTAIDDKGQPMELSADPMLEELKKTVSPEWYGSKCDRAAVTEILKNATLFGTDLVKAGLADKILEDLDSMLAGEGAVRKTLREKLN
ncbi:mannitol dehydrogenase family protein [Ruminococcus sp.]|uniref:mannitol dehydrogenase family protein n=1 Tax=Ruminococcus sp. TaxID=41978 RepID=UPI0025EFC210|nr:mannitol dehydrogenase family protein [Ruminococcus sp.]MBQ8968041.1 mannitol dehydrogenase family protein [Ruminococcus sp.]